MSSSRRGRRQALRSAPLGVLLLLALLVPAIASGSESAPPLCDVRVARDYGRAFERMPAEHPPPQGELPFGPRNLSLRYVDLGTRIAREGTRFGYWFAAKGAGRRVLRLDWDVEAVLWRVDRDGRERAKLATVKRHLSQIRDLSQLEFVFPARHLGSYRLDLRFRSFDGRRLGAYREYFRVVPRSVDVGIVVARQNVQPGERAYVQARNFGTMGVQVAREIPLERWTGSAWERLPAGSSITESVPWWLGTGEAASCSSYPIPADAAPGRYRFATSARVLGGSRQRLRLTAGFRVGGPFGGS